MSGTYDHNGTPLCRSLDEILSELRHAVKCRYGHLIVEVELRSKSGKVFTLPTDELAEANGYPPAPDPPSTKTTPDTPREPPENRSLRDEPLAVRVLMLLEDAGQRMSTTRIMTALARAGHDYSERKLQDTLARLVEEGTLDNRQNVRPVGYGLPEWPDTGPENRH